MSGLIGLVAEDEPPQREALVAMLGELWPELELRVCADGLSALEVLQSEAPAVAFLDIRMPGRSGLAIARESATGCQVVFTTAYDEYAVAAFEAGAIDYLLKPIRRERLQQAIERVRARLAQRQVPDLGAVLAQIEARIGLKPAQPLRWITASVGDSVRIYDLAEVQGFHAEDKYTTVLLRDGEATIRMTLRELLQALDADQFWQVHRSLIVRVAAIERVRKDELGRLQLWLKGRPAAYPVSQAMAARFRGM